MKLLESNVAKAQIEVAEVKADLTKEKLDYMHDLNYEKERSIKLDEAVELSRQQSILYEVYIVRFQFYIILIGVSLGRNREAKQNRRHEFCFAARFQPSD